MNKVIQDDCLEVMKELEDNSVDCVITDPPYGLEFMGKSWDKAVPSVEIWQECLRVMKSGAFAFIMCIPKQNLLARMIINLEDAGFDVDFTSLYHCFASGFPKACNVSKSIDAKKGAEREVIGKYNFPDGLESPNQKDHISQTTEFSSKAAKDRDITAPATPEAEIFDGWFGGMQPKPAVEVIICAMKPFKSKTFIDQALLSLEDETQAPGCVNFGDCRIPYTPENKPKERPVKEHHKTYKEASSTGFLGASEEPKKYYDADEQGRFPANLLASSGIDVNIEALLELQKELKNENS